MKLCQSYTAHAKEYNGDLYSVEVEFVFILVKPLSTVFLPILIMGGLGPQQPPNEIYT